MKKITEQEIEKYYELCRMSPLSREEYEKVCTEQNIKILTDKECKYYEGGDFTMDDYLTAKNIVFGRQAVVAQKRSKAMKSWQTYLFAKPDENIIIDGEGNRSDEGGYEN